MRRAVAKSASRARSGRRGGPACRVARRSPGCDCGCPAPHPARSRSARSEPWKSGTSTSTEVSGSRRLISVMQRANASAPKSGRSSRSTDVITACCRPIRATASARRTGSSGSKAGGRAVGDGAVGAVPGADVAQNHEGRGLCSQHSPTFGAARFLADGVEVELAHQALEVGVVRPAGRLDLEPARLPAARALGRGAPGSERVSCTSGTATPILPRQMIGVRPGKASRLEGPRPRPRRGLRTPVRERRVTWAQGRPQASTMACALRFTSAEARSSSSVGPRCVSSSA